MLLTSAFSKDNSDISLEEFNVFTTATRKLRVNEDTPIFRVVLTDVHRFWNSRFLKFYRFETLLTKSPLWS